MLCRNFLAEILFAVDRSYMADGSFTGDNRPPASITLTDANFGFYPMSNDLTRLQTRFLGEPSAVDAAAAETGKPLDAQQASRLGLVTFAFDDIDWEDEVRIFLEERASFSPDDPAPATRTAPPPPAASPRRSPPRCG